MDKKFLILDNWEKDGIFYIKTDYGELNTKDKKAYDDTINDGFIIIEFKD